MRLLFLIHGYPPDVIGGHEIRCQRTVEGLRQRGHDVLVLTTYRRENGLRKEGHVWRLLRSKWSEDPQRTAFKWVFVYRHNVKVYRQVLAEFQPDIICRWGLNWCTAAFVNYVHETAPVPVVVFVGGGIPAVPDDLWFHFCRTPAKGIVANLLKKALVRLASFWIPTEPKPITYDTVTFNSRFVRDWCMEREGWQVKRPIVIYGGVEISRYFPRSSESYHNNPPRFLFAGRIDPEKDPLTCLKAVTKLAQKGLPVKFTLAAGVSLHPDYEKQVFQRAIELDGFVQVRHNVPPSEMPKVLSEHDVFVFSSQIDWWPNALLEAMAAGLAVIATRCGGPDEILVDGENCLIFPFGDADALAERMEQLIHDPSLVIKLGQNARKLVEERFTLERYLDETEALLESVRRKS
ncbi:Putative glycosyltransferase EpsD [bacterium HR17]|uniref:Glycosyltransferase EpsD n=1 Tax=Candidatus Fervidibacter japonicus TaxID=2035412 RepID=A0A2H5XFD5_9BACT|nr:Putative glycosyltransferase EpsD [bacterium HR17]